MSLNYRQDLTLAWYLYCAGTPNFYPDLKGAFSGSSATRLIRCQIATNSLLHSVRRKKENKKQKNKTAACTRRRLQWVKLIQRPFEQLVFKLKCVMCTQALLHQLYVHRGGQNTFYFPQRSFLGYKRLPHPPKLTCWFSNHMLISKSPAACWR